MKLTFNRWAMALLIISLLPGCYPKGAEYIDELDLVYTNYDPSFDFKGNNTYAIPDSVIKIDGDNFEDPDGDGFPTFLTSDYSAAIVNAITQNMSAAGWTRVDKFDNPDVILLPSSMTTTNIYYYYDWYYWGWYYPGYYPGWGWYYPGYYPAYVEGYRSGSVMVQMMDHTNPNPDGDNVPVVWSCILNGLAEGSTASISSRIQTNMDQAFKQSPYLKH